MTAAERSAKVTLIGLGRVGTTLGLGLQRVKTNFEVVGHDKDPGRAALAHKRGAVDRTEWNLLRAVEGAGLVLLAIPALAVRETLAHIAPELAEGAVVSDTASTKAMILRWASEALPEHVHFIGGHPVLDPLGEPSAELLAGAHYALVPARGAHPQALQFMSGLVTSLGARPYFVGAEEHDGLMAAVADLPAAISAILIRAMAQSASWQDLQRLSGAGRYLKQLAPGSQAEQEDAVLTNRESLRTWLGLLEEELGRLRQALAEADEEAVRELFVQAFEARDRWTLEPRQLPEVSTQDLGWSRWLGLGRRKR